MPRFWIIPRSLEMTTVKENNPNSSGDKVSAILDSIPDFVPITDVDVKVVWALPLSAWIPVWVHGSSVPITDRRLEGFLSTLALSDAAYATQRPKKPNFRRMKKRATVLIRMPRFALCRIRTRLMK